MVDFLGFNNTTGLLAFLALIPFAVLYLMRPKPQDKVVPSLMFFLRTGTSMRTRNFLRNLLRDLVVFIQLLIILAAAFAAAEPFLQVPGVGSSGNVVLVIDASASMKAKYGSGTRFDEAKAEALKRVGRTTSIVLAKAIPEIILADGSRGEARNTVSSITATDTPTNIGDALLKAEQLLEGSSGKVIVISDLRATHGPDPLVVKQRLAAKGIETEFIPVAKDTENVAIINLDIGQNQSKVFVKNYNPEARKITLQVRNNRKEIFSEARQIAANSIEVFTVPVEKGVNEVTIPERDDLMNDNAAFISRPLRDKIRVLLVTNKESTNIRTALESSSNIELSVSVPPVIPDLNYDVIVLHQFDKKFMLPGFYSDMRDRVGQGAGIVITGQNDLAGINELADLLPVKLEELVQQETGIVTELDTDLTHEAVFGESGRYLRSAAKGNAIVFASAEDGSPMLAQGTVGSGTVFYYGIFDDTSGFRGTTQYPVFWNKVIKQLGRAESIEDFNFNTEKVFSRNAAQGQDSRLFLDQIGVYELGDREVAANLLNEQESDLSAEGNALLDEAVAGHVEGESQSRNVPIDHYLAIAVLILLFMELLYIKRRGDL